MLMFWENQINYTFLSYNLRDNHLSTCNMIYSINLYDS